MKKLRITAMLSALAMVLCGLVGCSSAPLSRSMFVLDTGCTVTLYDAQSEELLDACEALLTAREALWSRTAADSEVSAINAAGAAGVSVSADTRSLVETALFYAAMTDGAFDITTAPLTDLWQEAENNDTLPSAQALTEALAAVGSDHVAVVGETVTLTHGARIDLGGIAKGQIADDVVTLLKASDCTSALIDLGGNIVAYGTKPNGKPFQIGIADPRYPDSIIATVEVSDGSVVTSGSYERGYTIGETTYSHILDPKTGQPVQNDLLSVTILSPLSVDGDVLSTACFVMGYEAATAFLESFDDIEAVFVKTDGSVVATDGVVLAD